MKQNKPADQDRLLSSPTFLRLAKPGAFSLIGNERDVVVAHTLTTTAAAAACFITVSLRELVVFPLPDAGTSLDTGLDARHCVVLEVGLGARFDHCHCALAPGRGCECGFSSGLKVLNPPLWLITTYNPIVDGSLRPAGAT